MKNPYEVTPWSSGQGDYGGRGQHRTSTTGGGLLLDPAAGRQNDMVTRKARAESPRASRPASCLVHRGEMTRLTEAPTTPIPLSLRTQDPIRDTSTGAFVSLLVMVLARPQRPFGDALSPT
jgi:hypothetical protein